MWLSQKDQTKHNTFLRLRMQSVKRKKGRIVLHITVLMPYEWCVI